MTDHPEHDSEPSIRQQSDLELLKRFMLLILASLINGCSVNRPQDTIVYQRNDDPSSTFYSYATLNASDAMPNPDNVLWTEMIAIERGFPGNHVRTRSTLN